MRKFLMYGDHNMWINTEVVGPEKFNQYILYKKYGSGEYALLFKLFVKGLEEEHFYMHHHNALVYKR